MVNITANLIISVILLFIGLSLLGVGAYAVIAQYPGWMRIAVIELLLGALFTGGAFALYNSTFLK